MKALSFSLRILSSINTEGLKVKGGRAVKNDRTQDLQRQLQLVFRKRICCHLHLLILLHLPASPTISRCTMVDSRRSGKTAQELFFSSSALACRVGLVDLVGLGWSGLPCHLQLSWSQKKIQTELRMLSYLIEFKLLLWLLLLLLSGEDRSGSISIVSCTDFTRLRKQCYQYRTTKVIVKQKVQMNKHPPEADPRQ